MNYLIEISCKKIHSESKKKSQTKMLYNQASHTTHAN